MVTGAARHPQSNLADDGSLAWEFRLPVLTNPFVWYDLAKVFVIVYVVIVVLMGGTFLVAGTAEDALRVARVFAFVCGGLFVFCLLVAAIWYRKGAAVRFTLTPKGVRYEALGRKDKAVNRALVVCGLLAGRPSAAGAGLIARTRETEFVGWREVRRVKAHAAARVVTLMSGWRVLQRLHCTRDDYERILDYALGHAACGQGGRRRSAS